jgi:hypothetical protein
VVIGHWSLVIGHWSLVTGHWSLVTGHWSLVTGHWLLVIGHWSLVIGSWFLVLGIDIDIDCWFLKGLSVLICACNLCESVRTIPGFISHRYTQMEDTDFHRNQFIKVNII